MGMTNACEFCGNKITVGQHDKCEAKLTKIKDDNPGVGHSHAMEFVRSWQARTGGRPNVWNAR